MHVLRCIPECSRKTSVPVFPAQIMYCDEIYKSRYLPKVQRRWGFVVASITIHLILSGTYYYSWQARTDHNNLLSVTSFRDEKLNEKL